MIELTSQSGERIALNPATVWHIRPAGEQTAIYSASGAVLFVTEPFATVFAALNGGAEGQAA